MKMKILFRVSLLLLAGIAIAAGIQAAPPDGGLLWSFQTGNVIDSNPAIAADGTVYIGSDDGYLYALTPNGALKWKYYAGTPIWSSPAIGPDGSIYIGSNSYSESGTIVHAVTPDGIKKWVYAGSGNGYKPAVGPDGIIYIGTGKGLLLALNPDGTKKWGSAFGNGISSAPAIGADGNIYFGGWDKRIYALNRGGYQLWSILTEGNVDSSPAIGADGVIYVGSWDKNLYAVYPNGQIKWTFRTAGGVISSPAIGPTGTIYFGSMDGIFYAVNTAGAALWTFKTGDGIRTSPAVGADGVIYFGSNDKKLYALNLNGTLLWSYTTGGRIENGPSIAPNGTVYFGSDDHCVYALKSSSLGLAQSSWPKFRNNSQNTGMSSFTGTLTFYADAAPEFEIIKPGEKIRRTLRIVNSSNDDAVINSIRFDNPAFHCSAVLPLIVKAQTSFTLTIETVPTDNGYYNCSYQLGYQLKQEKNSTGGKLTCGVLYNDGSERGLLAQRAYSAYQRCLLLGKTRADTLNNRGVILRLLGAYTEASACFKQALQAVSMYGYGGIKMNLGVINSDQKESKTANGYYESALTDTSAGVDNSVLTPQLVYNKAWELYAQGEWYSAMTLLQKVIVHPKANAFLQAKSYVLLGAAVLKLGKTADARDMFVKAQTLDPQGPIGRMAAANLAALAK